MFKLDGVTICANGGKFNDLSHYHLHIIPIYIPENVLLYNLCILSAGSPNNISLIPKLSLIMEEVKITNGRSKNYYQLFHNGLACLSLEHAIY